MSRCRIQFSGLHARIAVFAALGVLASGAHAGAQTRVTGPFAGLFGGAKADNSQSLDVRGTVFGLWQDVVVPAGTDPTLLDPLFQENGTLAGATGELTYSFNRASRSSQFGANANALVADYSTDPTRPVYAFNGGTSISTSLTRRIRFSGQAAAFYSPYVSINNALQGFGATPSIDTTGQVFSPLPYATATGRVDNILANLGLNITTALSSRSSIYAALDYSQFFALSEDRPTHRQWTSRVGYQRALSQRVSLRAGYQRGESVVVGDDGNSSATQGFDFSLDYANTLRVARRTTFAFSTAVIGAGTPGDSRIHYNLTGNATLTHAIGRTWSSSVGYNRSLGFIPGSAEPILNDTITGSIGGLLTRRLSSTSNVTITRGEVGFVDSRGLESYSATSSLSLALTRNFAAFAVYNYLHSDIPADLTEFVVLPNFDRQTVMVGLTVYAPIFGDRRRSP